MFRVSSGFVAQLINTLEAEGIDSARLCRDANIDSAVLRQPDSFVRRADVYRLMALAQAESQDSDLGLRAYRHFLPGGFQLVGYTMMSSPNLKGALNSLTRYQSLLGSGVQVGVSQEEEGERLWAVDDMDLVPKPRSFEDAGLAAMLGYCHWLTGGSLPCLREVEFTYPEPADTSEHQRLFGCKLRFGSSRHSILFDQGALMHPMSTANEALALLHDRLAEQRMEQLRKATYTERTRLWLIEHLNQGGYDMSAVASGLKLNPRTLQRGLAREATNFRDVLDRARRQLAEYYLRSSTYNLSQISDLLGFKEASSFHKACLRWFDAPPGRYRVQLCSERNALT